MGFRNKPQGFFHITYGRVEEIPLNIIQNVIIRKAKGLKKGEIKINHNKQDYVNRNSNIFEKSDNNSVELLYAVLIDNDVLAFID